LIISSIAFAVDIALCHSHVLEGEIRTDSEVVDRLLGKKIHFLLDFGNFILIIMFDALFEKGSNFGPFEQKGHNEIVYIFILDQSSLSRLSQKLQSINIRNY